MNQNDLDKLENIVYQLYGPNPSKDLLGFADNLKKIYINNITQFPELFEKFKITQNNHMSFWILDVLIELIKSKYLDTSGIFTKNLKDLFRENLLNIFIDIKILVNKPTFILNKFCYLSIIFIKYDFPENNNSFFTDLIKNIIATNDQNEKLEKINNFLELLITFDDELIKFRNTFTDYDSKKSTIIKDYLRLQGGVNDFLGLIFQIITNEEYIDYKIIIKSMKVISQLIDWNPLNIFTNNLNIIFSKIIQKNKYINQSLEIYNSIIKKGMDLLNKIELLQKMNINNILQNLIINKDNDIEIMERICEIINNIGVFLIECFANIKTNTININDNNNNCNLKNVYDYCSDELNTLFYFINLILKSKNFDYKIVNQFQDFLANIINYFKGNEFILENNQNLFNSFKSFLFNIENLIKIPSELYQLDKDLSQYMEDDYFNFRSDFSVLYFNIFNIKSFDNLIIDSIKSKAQNILSNNNNNLYDLEHLLFLINILQNAIKPTTLKDKDLIEKENELVNILFMINFVENNSDFILLSYYETICKIVQLYINNTQHIEFLLNLFIGNHGICHSNMTTGVKILSYFDRFLSKVKQVLVKINCLDSIFIKTKENMKIIINSNNFLIISQYQDLFNCLGIILSVNTNLENKVKEYQESFNLILSFFNKSIDGEKFCEIIKYLTTFIKHIINPIREYQIKNLFLNFFDVFINKYLANYLTNNNCSLNILTSVIALFQRLIIILENECTNYIETFFNTFLNHNQLNFDNFEITNKLLQNLINVLKKKSIKIIQQCLYSYYNFTKSLVIPNDNISDINRNILSIYGTFLKFMVIIFTDIPVIFTNQNYQINNNDFNVNILLDFLIFIGCNIIDANSRKIAVKSLKAFSLYFSKNFNDFNSPNFYELFTKILDGGLSIAKKLNLNDVIDQSTLSEIAIIHNHLCIFTDFYTKYLLNILNKEQAETFYAMIKTINVNKIKLEPTLIDAFKVSFL